MGEINGPKISVNSVNYTGIQKQNIEPQPENAENSVQITDFSDAKAEALGRSMLFKGADSINNDLKALMENPAIAETSDKMFETAYNVALASGMENPYEEAAVASTTSM